MIRLFSFGKTLKNNLRREKQTTLFFFLHQQISWHCTCSINYVVLSIWFSFSSHILPLNTSTFLSPFKRQLYEHLLKCARSIMYSTTWSSVFQLCHKTKRKRTSRQTKEIHSFNTILHVCWLIIITATSIDFHNWTINISSYLTDEISINWFTRSFFFLLLGRLCFFLIVYNSLSMIKYLSFH